MTITLFAQPYNLDANGFYFTSGEDYSRKSLALRDAYGNPVEEFEIQFIDGEHIDCDLAKAWGLSQCNIEDFFRVAEEWSSHEKTMFIIAVGECGHSFDAASIRPYDFDVDLYFEDSMRDLAIQFVEEGLFGEVPKSFEHYIDYDAIPRDLACDYTETEVGGERLIYQCA